MALIIGAGMTVFGRHPDRSFGDLGAEAVHGALKSAQISLKQVEEVVCANVLGGMLPGQRVLREFGFSDTPVTNIENACASGGSALHHAVRMVDCGERDLVLVLGVEKLSALGGGLLPQDADDLEVQQGITLPASYALRATRYMAQYGATVEDLARVSVKSHENAALNKYAQFRDPWTVEDVLRSRMVAEPLTLYMCCPNSDGAAAVIVCSHQVAKQHTLHPVHVRASALVSGHFDPVRDITVSGTTSTAVGQAYERAGIGPDDLDLVECHDPFAIAELLYYEVLGLAPAGEAVPLLKSGGTSLGGRTPVNPSGGLLARGHPIGATGVAQVVEAWWQFRGEAGARQVNDPKVALTHVTGGGISGYDNGACTIHVLTT